MNKMTLSRKLIFLCVALLGVTAGVGYVSYVNLSRVTQEYESIIQENMPKQRMAMELLLHFRSVRVQLLTLGLKGLPADQSEIAIKRAKEEIESYEKVSKSFMGTSFLPGEEKLFESVEESWSEFKKVGQKVLKAHKEHDFQALLSEILYQGPEASAKFKTAAVALINFHKDMAETRSMVAESNSAQALRLTLVLMGLGLVMGMVLGIYLARSISRGLSTITENLGASGQEVNAASDSLAAISQELASASQEQASSVEEVSSSLEEISGMVSSTVQGTQNVLELVTSGNESMTQLQGSVQQISDSNSRVEQLVKLIEEIGEKTELIDEIVFQTRLLSFNASVEAERAGEHGRGFAVVAQEVGNLAQMSGKSAAEISQIVKNSIKTAQEVAQLNRTKVDAGASLCKETAQKLDSIQKAAHEILRASKEQNSGIQQINQSIQLISKSTQENASSAEVCSENSGVLNGQVSRLSGLVEDLRQVVTGRRGTLASAHKGGKSAVESSLAGSASESRDDNVVHFKKDGRGAQGSRARSGSLPTGVRPVSQRGNLAQKEDAWDEI